jgi:putative membrane protein
MEENQIEKKQSPMIDWFIRFLKGILVGVGFITPGLSGGVLAVVFGIYEPLMRFLGNLRDKFFKNLVFFLPVGIGGVVGVVAFSAVVDFAFSNYPGPFTWLFIGFIAGTFPSLFKTSGQQGRKWGHWLLLVLTAGGMVFLMRWMETIRTVQLTPSFINWLFSGALIGLGVVVPGMSPSNFLIYVGLYQPMAFGIRHLDLGVIVPLALGGLICVLLLARLISWLFKRFYAVMYHLILGIVIGSTIAIIPEGIRGWALGASAILFLVGALISYALAKLDEKYSREEIQI